MVSIDPALVAAAAMRELSALEPAAFAVASRKERSIEWSRSRVDAFRALAASQGRECPAIERRQGEDRETFSARLDAWVAALPRGTAIFAANGATAREITAAARAHARSIPRELSLLCVFGTEKDTGPMPNGISHMQFDFERIGFLAARMLDEWAHGRRPPGAIERMGPLCIVRGESTRGRGRREPRILEALDTIRAEACNGLTARALAARFPGSRRLFDMRFREATGHSVLEEILHVRMEKAKMLLAQTDTAIGAIAGLCGFGTETDLGILFRRRTGLSLRDWRRKNSWKN